MSIEVTPKKEVKGNAQFFGDAFGMSAIINLEPGQKWYAAHSKGYWHLRKKRSGIELRLTDAAMNRLFEEAKK